MATTLSMPALILGILAVWRVTHVLWGEDGPGRIFVRLRRLAGTGFWGRLMDCFYCLSVWVAAPAAWVLGGTWTERVLLWLGLSGGAILLERATAMASSLHPPAAWHVENLPGPAGTPDSISEEKDDVVLR